MLVPSRESYSFFAMKPPEVLNRSTPYTSLPKAMNPETLNPETPEP